MGEPLLKLVPKVDIVGVPSKQARAVWVLAEPLLAPAIALTGGAFEPSDVLDRIEAMDSQLWLAIIDGAVIGAVVSAIDVYPRMKALCCPFVGGDIGRLDEWKEPMFDRIEEFARAKGCARIEGGVRKGWARALPGMREIGVMLRKELS